MSPPSNITNLENNTQFKLVKYPNSKKVNDLLLHNKTPINLYDNLLTVHGTGKGFELKGDLLKIITKKNCNDDLAELVDEKLRYDFAKAMYFDEKSPSKKVPEIDHLYGGLSYLLSWFLEVQEKFYKKILINFVIDWNYYYKKTNW